MVKIISVEHWQVKLPEGNNAYSLKDAADQVISCEIHDALTALGPCWLFTYCLDKKVVS